MLEAYRMVHRFRVPFSDVDLLRHVNNVAYLRWAEHVRTEYVAEILGEEIGGRHGIILATLQVTYEKVIGYRESVAIGCRVGRIGTKSLDFGHEIWSDDRAVRCATIASTVVAMDYEAAATIAVPGAWRARIAAFEQAAA